MRRKLSFILIVFSLLLISCDSGSALAYNNKIIEIQTTVAEKMLSLADSFKTGNSSLMSERLKSLQDQTRIAADKLNSIPEFKGGEDMFNAAMDLFEFYEAISKAEFAEMVDILSKGRGGINQADVERLKEIQRTITIDESKLDMKFQMAQREFATSHNLKIKPNKLQKRINNM